MKNNNTKKLNFNFIERQPIEQKHTFFFCLETDQEKIKEKMLEVYRELYENDESL